MLFAPDTELTLAFAVALANTHPAASRSALDEIATPPELTALVDEHGYSGRFDRDDAALEVNAFLSEANALPFLVRHDQFDWHLHATPLDAPLAERIRVEVALALMDVVRTDEWHRMRVCDAPDCEGVLVDLSKNGSKRFCSVRCGNRMNQVAYRERAAG